MLGKQITGGLRPMQIHLDEEEVLCKNILRRPDADVGLHAGSHAGHDEDGVRRHMVWLGGHTLARRGLALDHAWHRCGPPGHRLTPPLRLFNSRYGYTLST